MNTESSRMALKRHLPWTAAIVAVLALAACGGRGDSHESVAEAALREAAEEAGIDRSLVTVLGSQLGVDDGNWSYTYILALAGDGLAVAPITSESDELRWVDLDEVTGMALHVGLGQTWPELRRGIDRALLTRSG